MASCLVAIHYVVVNEREVVQELKAGSCGKCLADLTTQGFTHQQTECRANRFASVRLFLFSVRIDPTELVMDHGVERQVRTTCRPMEFLVEAVTVAQENVRNSHCGLYPTVEPTLG